MVLQDQGLEVGVSGDKCITFARLKRAKKWRLLFRLLIKGINNFFDKILFQCVEKRQLNLWYPAPCWSRASYHRLLLQQSQNRRRLHTSHSHDFLIYSVWERMLTPPSQWRVLSMCGRCLGRTTSSLGLFPLKMGWAGGTPPIFWGKSPEDKVVRRKRGMRIHRRASKQERGFFLFFPALSAQPSRSLARKAMSELG